MLHRRGLPEDAYQACGRANGDDSLLWRVSEQAFRPVDGSVVVFEGSGDLPTLGNRGNDCPSAPMFNRNQENAWTLIMEPLWDPSLLYLGTVVYPDRVGLTCELTIRRTSHLHSDIYVATVPDEADSRSLLIYRATGFVVDMGCYAYFSRPPQKKAEISQYTDKELGERWDWLRRLGEQFTSSHRVKPIQLAAEEAALHEEMFRRNRV